MPDQATPGGDLLAVAHMIAALVPGAEAAGSSPASGADTPEDSPTRDHVVVHRAGPGELEVVLRWDRQAFVVDLEGFELRFDRGDEDAVAEVCDLLAAALVGRARVCRMQVADAVVGWQLQFKVANRWVTHARRAGTRRRWPWQRVQTEVLCNALVPGAGITLGESGRLASVPWVGTLAGAAAEPGPAPLPVDGELDLHPFSPKEVKPLVLEYIEACRARGIHELRLVHGKGIGNLRRTVHALLERHEAVQSYRLGGHGEGGWGATLVVLRPQRSPEASTADSDPSSDPGSGWVGR